MALNGNYTFKNNGKCCERKWTIKSSDDIPGESEYWEDYEIKGNTISIANQEEDMEERRRQNTYLYENRIY